MTRQKKNWHQMAPLTRQDRRALFETCGSDSFYMPNPKKPGLSKYPKSARLSSSHGKKNTCKLECEAVKAAYRYASKYNVPKQVFSKMKKDEKNCLRETHLK